MASRPVGNGNISFGLVSIPVRLFPATRSKSVSFNLLHAKDQEPHPAENLLPGR